MHGPAWAVWAQNTLGRGKHCFARQLDCRPPWADERQNIDAPFGGGELLIQDCLALPWRNSGFQARTGRADGVKTVRDPVCSTGRSAQLSRALPAMTLAGFRAAGCLDAGCFSGRFGAQGSAGCASSSGGSAHGALGWQHNCRSKLASCSPGCYFWAALPAQLRSWFAPARVLLKLPGRPAGA